MVTFAEIEETLEKGSLSREQSRAIVKAIELSQRKTQEEVETDLRSWMDKRFATKEEFHKEMGQLRAELIKWMFIFWVGQIAAFTAIVKLLGK